MLTPVRCVQWMVVLVMVAIASAANAQTKIVLRTRATIGQDEARADRVLMLTDIADVSGQDAERLGSIAIRPSVVSNTGEATIRIEDVRAALDQAVPRVNWGRVMLSGAACTVQFRQAAAPERVRKAVTEPREVVTPQPVEGDLTAGTVRAAVIARLLDLYTVTPQDLRVAFEAGDAELLDTPLMAPGDANGASPTAQRRVDVQPGGGATSGRVPVSILIYDGDRVTRSASITVQAQVQRDVVLARSAIARNQAVTADMVQTARQWQSPSAKPPLTLDQVVGGVSMTRVAAGAIIATGDVAAPIACKRGELIYVHVLSGPVTVKAKARAMSQARDGELVQLKIEGSKETFTARMSGRGRAVLMVAGDDVRQPNAQKGASAPDQPEFSEMNNAQP